MVEVRETYEVITPESAEHGDAAERGFIGPMGMHCDDSEPHHEEYSFSELVDLLETTEPRAC